MGRRHPFDWAAIIAALLSLGGMVYIEATHNDKENAQRISKLEQSRDDMKDKVDHIQQQIDKLVDWALGHQ